MPDITLCKGTTKNAFPLSVEVEVTEDFECPLKDNCHRYFEHHKNNLSVWQSYFIGVPYNQETKTCNYYETKNSES